VEVEKSNMVMLVSVWECGSAFLTHLSSS
jgi:hypothetical protein